MAYVDNGKKLDWAMSFQRTGTFPLDRSSIFSSYADLIAYAKQDGSDERAIGGTSYVGQVVVNYGPGQDGTTEEIAVYVITAVGENAAVEQLAASSSTASDLSELQAAFDAAVATLTAKDTALDEKDAELQSAIDNVNAFVGNVTSPTSDSLKSRIDAIRSEIDNTLTGLTGAMHYRGISTTQPDTDGATVSGVTEFTSGDVVVYTTTTTVDGETVNVNKEYVYDGTSWRELGDEGSHLTKDEAFQKYLQLGSTVNGVGLTNEGISIYADIINLNSSSTVTIADQLETLQKNIDSANSGWEAAINALDYSSATDTDAGLGVDKTITTVTQTDGSVKVVASSIQIAQSQVTGLEAAIKDLDDTKVDIVTGYDLISDELTAKLEALAVINSVDEVEFSLDSTTGKLNIGAIASSKITGLDTSIADLQAEVDSTIDGIKLANSTETLAIVDQVVTLPIATASAVGLILSSSAENTVSVNSSTGVATVNSLNVNLLTQTDGDTFILDGGTASI